jgi:hypothetical protein
MKAHGGEHTNKKQTPWRKSASELCRPSDRRLSAKLVLITEIIEDRGCYVDSMTNPYGRILGFLDRSRYFFFKVAPVLTRMSGRVWGSDSIIPPLFELYTGLWVSG